MEQECSCYQTPGAPLLCAARPSRRLHSRGEGQSLAALVSSPHDGTGPEGRTVLYNRERLVEEEVVSRAAVDGG